MNFNRRNFIKSASAVSLAGAVIPKSLRAKKKIAGTTDEQLIKAASAPVLKTSFFRSKIKIASIELLKRKKEYIVRVRSSNGAEGIAAAHKKLDTTYPILLRKVKPFFIKKDARDLDSLIDGVYLWKSNYKWQGLPFWICVASVEMAILDLLGRIAKKPVGELLGSVVRRDIGFYSASSNRGNTAEKEVLILQKKIKDTDAKAVKFKLGGRMKYSEKSTRRDKAIIPLARKVLGDKITIYTDANGSFDVPKAIEIGKVCEVHNAAFFEEPCPFDHYEETKQVADALKIPIAGGEQESSTRAFRWLIKNNAHRIVQPDLFYFGGFIRSIRVARMAAAAKIKCTPHISGGGWGFLYVSHFASCVPNTGPHMEFKGYAKIPVTCDTSSLKSKDGFIKVPSGPGWGVNIDPSYLKKAKAVKD